MKKFSSVKTTLDFRLPAVGFHGRRAVVTKSIPNIQSSEISKILLSMISGVWAFQAKWGLSEFFGTLAWRTSTRGVISDVTIGCKVRPPAALSTLANGKAIMMVTRYNRCQWSSHCLRVASTIYNFSLFCPAKHQSSRSRAILYSYEVRPVKYCSYQTFAVTGCFHTDWLTIQI